MSDTIQIESFIRKAIVLNFFVSIYCSLIGTGYLYVTLYYIFTPSYSIPIFPLFLVCTYYALAIFNIRALYLLKFKSDYLGIKINRILYLIQIGFFTFFLILFFPLYTWYIGLLFFSFLIVLFSLLMIYYLNLKKEEIKKFYTKN
ncbi:MAG: hypothetical protein EU529_15505 [Promethearchaeota archaeon]|nr:MAG: hypothetical protein EU529_15505 [Candidatus Lokiarchaeota archaeon]